MYSYIGLDVDQNNIIIQKIYPSECGKIQAYLDPSQIIIGLSKFINGQLINPSQEEINNFYKQKEKEIQNSELRNQRKPLLAAFDIWEKAVLRGREDDNNEIMQWYQAILDLDELAINTVPERIQHYL